MLNKTKTKPKNWTFTYTAFPGSSFYIYSNFHYLSNKNRCNRF